MPAVVAVTGAGGFVGRRLARALRQAGVEVRAVVHRASAADGLRRLGCEIREADVRDRAALLHAVQGCRAVIHLVAILRERGALTFEAVNRQGTAHAVEAAARAGAERFIHLSALGASPDGPRYLRSKWQGEEAVRAAAIPWVIFRPSILLGPGGGAARQFADVVRFGLWYPLAGGRLRPLAALGAAALPVVPVLGHGRYRSAPVALDDVIPAIVAALQRDDALGGTFEIPGPEVVSYDELLRRVARVLGLRRVLWHLPPPAVEVVLRLSAYLPSPPITRDEYEALVVDNVGDAGPAVALFGLRRRSLDQALREALAPGEENTSTGTSSPGRMV
ncbi:MAG TPA: NAD(P)H-binding protein [bacterium]|nr:NAD(P)H-binding protein [bacterium]